MANDARKILGFGESTFKMYWVVISRNIGESYYILLGERPRRRERVAYLESFDRLSSKIRHFDSSGGRFEEIRADNASPSSLVRYGFGVEIECAGAGPFLQAER